jgi:hypothetical protein
VNDFNKTIVRSGTNRQGLLADTGKGFTLVAVGYAFYAVSVVSTLSIVQTRSPNAFGKSGAGGNNSGGGENNDGGGGDDV